MVTTIKQQLLKSRPGFFVFLVIPASLIGIGVIGLYRFSRFISSLTIRLSVDSFSLPFILFAVDTQMAL